MAIMQEFNVWYKENGVRNTTAFLDPKMIDISTYTYPKNVLLHWSYTDINPIGPRKNASVLFNTPEHVIVKTLYEYPDYTGLLGRFHKQVVTVNNVIKEFAKQEINFTFLNKDINLEKGPLYMYIYNYGMIDSVYKYTENLLSNYHRAYNFVATLISNIGKMPTRQDLFIIPVPSILPSIIRLNEMSEKVTTKNLSYFPTYKHIMFLELWKLLIPAYRESSLFNLIPKGVDPVFMFVSNKKVMTIKLSILINSIKEYSDGTGSTYKALAIRKLLYKHILSLTTDSLVNKLKVNMNMIKPDSMDDFLLNDDDDIVTDDKPTNTDYEEEQIEDIKKEDEILADELTSVDDEEVVKGSNKLKTQLDTIDNDITTIDDLNKDISKFDNVSNKLDIMYSNNLITKQQYDKLTKFKNEQMNIKNKYCDETLGTVLDYTKDNYDINKNLISIESNPIIFNNSDNNKTIQAIDKQYLETQYKKDLTRVLYSVQNNSSVVLDHEVTDKVSVAGALEEHTLTIQTLNGGSEKLKLVLPKIDKDGKFMYSNSQYIMRYQKLDIPILKTGPYTVALTSFYGKFFITKGRVAVENVGKWYLNNIAKLQDNGVTGLVTGNNDNQGLKLPVLYSLLSRNIKYFRYKDYTFTFEYVKRFELLKTIYKDNYEEMDKKFKKDDLVFLGKYKSLPLLMDNLDRIFIYKNGNYEELPPFEDILELNTSNMPIETACISILGKHIYLVVVLSYYIGLTNLLDLFDVNYKLIESNKRYPLEKNEYMVRFQDTKLVIERDFGKRDMIFGGLIRLEKILKLIPISVMGDKNLFNVLFSYLEYNINLVNEIRLLETMFVDPITKTVLKEMGEPLNFKGLLIRAADMLVDDYYENPNSIKNSIMKGYERIPGMVYKELVSAIKEHENRSYFSKSKITINPYGVLNKIQEDSSTVAVDNLNPIALIKQKEDSTQIGFGGRNKISVGKDARQVDPSYIGVFGEGHKDSGDVGISSSFTANPKLSNLRGQVGGYEKDKDGWSSRISTSSMLAPFGLTDDTKRLNFVSIMNSHVIPIASMRAPYVLTGYESIIACKADSGFAISAEDDGVVISSEPNVIKVKYKTLGEKEYKYSDWTTKEESGGCYTHRLKANFNKGDKFVKDDTLVYNTSFFEPCSFYPNRVIYKQGDLVTVALMENMDTHEDSGSMSERLSTRLKANVTKVISTVVDVGDNISGYLNIGDKVTSNDSLYNIYDKLVGDDLDEETLKVLMSLNSRAPKAKVKGVITKIDVRYNAELDDMSNTMKAFVNKIDKITKARTGFTGRVDGTYSVKGKKLLPNTMEIKYYIDTEDLMGIGDKAILGNQMKFTIGDIFFNDVTGVDNTPIDMIFSARSISNRIVNSPYIIGTTSMVLEKLKDKAVDLYFNS